jgi:hypothetical protein
LHGLVAHGFDARHGHDGAEPVQGHPEMGDGQSGFAGGLQGGAGGRDDAEEPHQGVRGGADEAGTTKAAGKAATRRLEAQFTKLDDLLTRRLDKLAVKFKESAPEFYEAYRASRSIVQPATRAGKEAEVVPVPKAA